MLKNSQNCYKHDVLEPSKTSTLASRDVTISSQNFGSKCQRVFALGDGCWLPHNILHNALQCHRKIPSLEAFSLARGGHPHLEILSVKGPFCNNPFVHPVHNHERKSSPKSKFRGRISGGRPRRYPGGRPGAKASVMLSKSWKNKDFGADVHDPKARTSITSIRGVQKNFGQKNFGLNFRSRKQVSCIFAKRLANQPAIAPAIA